MGCTRVSCTMDGFPKAGKTFETVGAEKTLVLSLNAKYLCGGWQGNAALPTTGRYRNLLIRRDLQRVGDRGLEPLTSAV